MEYSWEAKALNDCLLALVQKSEHESVLVWYEEQPERVEDAKLKAESHLDERKLEEVSVAESYTAKMFPSVCYLRHILPVSRPVQKQKKLVEKLQQLNLKQRVARGKKIKKGRVGKATGT